MKQIAPRGRTSFSANLIFVAAAIVFAAALARPVFFMSGERKADYLSRKNGIALNSALIEYSQSHGGTFPGDGVITGGSGDALTRGGFLRKYPSNPFSSDGKPMIEVPPGEFSPGNFSYRRDAEKKYEYELVVYGAKKAVFERRIGAQ
jgi:hypothetical protein